MEIGNRKCCHSAQKPLQLKYNMLIIGLLIATAACASAASPKEEIAILAQQFDLDVDGTYKNFYETANGIKVQESGFLKNPGNKDSEAEEVQGAVSYVSDDGTPVSLSYIANENGYQPQGSHLPVAPSPPPVPAYILRALEYIEAHPPKPEKP